MTAPATPLTGPLARDALRQVTQVLVPCGATFEAVCLACAKRAQGLRAEQCRDGWHLEDEPPDHTPAPGEDQEFWLALRARAQVLRDQARADGQDTADLDQAITELDDELAVTGIRGSLARTTGSTGDDATPKARRARSTRNFHKK